MPAMVIDLAIRRKKTIVPIRLLDLKQIVVALVRACVRQLDRNVAYPLNQIPSKLNINVLYDCGNEEERRKEKDRRQTESEEMDIRVLVLVFAFAFEMNWNRPKRHTIKCKIVFIDSRCPFKYKRMRTYDACMHAYLYPSDQWISLPKGVR